MPEDSREIHIRTRVAHTRHLALTLLFMLSLLAAPGYAQDSTAVDSTQSVSPRKALYLSFVPGGGQLYNKRPLKALLFAGVFAYYSYEFVLAEDDLNQDPTDSDLHRKRNDKVWMLGLTWTLNIIDAYVDAQFWDFDKYDIDDEALPDPEFVKPKETGNSDDTE